MRARRWAGAACLLVVTMAALGMARAQPDQELIWTDESPAVPLEESPLEEAARQALRAHFYRRYTEAACSAVYTDLTHDGRPELLVLEMGEDRTGEPLALHSGPVDPDRFAAAQVSVLGAGDDGTVTPLYQFQCGFDRDRWGRLYLCRREGRAYLLRLDLRTADRRSDFALSLFSLGEDGGARDALRSGVSFALAPEDARPGDAAEEEIAAFEDLAAELLEDAKAVILCDAVHDRASGTDSQRQFGYLDELFTDF